MDVILCLWAVFHAEVGKRVQQIVCRCRCWTLLSHAAYSWWVGHRFTSGVICSKVSMKTDLTVTYNRFHACVLSNSLKCDEWLLNELIYFRHQMLNYVMYRAGND